MYKYYIRFHKDTWKYCQNNSVANGIQEKIKDKCKIKQKEKLIIILCKLKPVFINLS